MAGKRTKFNKPTVSLTRDKYKFVLGFSNIDPDASKIHIEFKETPSQGNGFVQAMPIVVYDEKSTKTTSWSYSIKKEHYYPFIADGTESNPKESDPSKRLASVSCKVYVDGYYEYTTTSGKGKKKKTKKHKVFLKSDTVSKSYKFKSAKEPGVSLSYNNDGGSFNFVVDINDDYGIDDDYKSVATRTWAWLEKQIKGGSKDKVPGYTGKWYNRDVSPNISSKISTEISPLTPVRYIGYAYSGGPGGKSSVVQSEHTFAIPKAPSAPRIIRPNVLEKSDVDNSYGIYQVSWNIDDGGGWNPVDTISVDYIDIDDYKGDSLVNGEDMGKWSEAVSGLNGSIRSIQTPELGAVGNDKIRYFRITAKHDNNIIPGHVSGVVGFGKPSNVGSFTARQPEDYPKDAIQFDWSDPPSRLEGMNANTKLYNGGTLGDGGRLRILIFKNTTSSEPIHTIYYGSDEWNEHQWVYDLSESKEVDQKNDYCIQVRVGLDNLDPGARSDNLWVRNVVVQAKCKNVKATRLSNNTSVELTWDNPQKDDTVRNGVEVAWSTFPHAWKSNNLPSTAKFSDGAMTKAYITGLTAGEYYYFWVRRYNEQPDGTIVYSLWSETSPGILMANKPDTPILTLSRSWVKEGGNLSAQWIYYASGNLPQESAQIEISTDKQKWVPIASVDSESDNCTLDFGNKVNGKYEYSRGTYYLRVVVKNAMGSSESEALDFKIATIPTCSLSSSSIKDLTYEVVDSNNVVETRTAKAITSMPISVNATGNGDLHLYLYCADNYERERPDCVDSFYSGNCVWTSSISEGDNSIDGVQLIDGGKYRLLLECVDNDTLLTSDEQYIDFEVHWERKAIAPTDSTVEISEDEVATLKPIKPPQASSDDVCDIYRTTADGRQLCYSGAKWGDVIRDVLPTFGETIEPAYCFCTRTSDGDEAWCDITYELSGSGIIIDYGYDTIRLPWNVNINDNRSKQGEIRSHLGGSKMYYGQPFIERSQSLSAEIVKMDNEDIVDKLYELSRYTQLCYIRTSNCIGYPATIDVKVDRNYNDKIIGVSLEAKETDSNGEYFAKKMNEQ